jgi:hypothetical protein
MDARLWSGYSFYDFWKVALVEYIKQAMIINLVVLHHKETFCIQGQILKTDAAGFSRPLVPTGTICRDIPQDASPDTATRTSCLTFVWLSAMCEQKHQFSFDNRVSYVFR